MLGISKEDFVRMIEAMREFDDKDGQLYKLGVDLTGLNSDIITELRHCLEMLVHDENNKVFGTTLAWWLYDVDYGRSDGASVIWLDKDGTEREFDLSTASRLYDYFEAAEKDRLDMQRENRLNAMSSVD